MSEGFIPPDMQVGSKPQSGRSDFPWFWVLAVFVLAYTAGKFVLFVVIPLIVGIWLLQFALWLVPVLVVAFFVAVLVF